MRENEEIYVSDEIDRSDLKVPANPIPYHLLKRFRYRLVEKSRDYPERNESLFLLQVATGYRAQDLVELLIGDIYEALECGYFSIQEKKQIKAYETHRKKHFEKYGKETTRQRPSKREVDIHKNSDAYKVLVKYIKGKKKSERAFPSKGKFGYLTSKSYSRILKSVGEDLGLENITGHSPRKTNATIVYEDTRDIVAVKRHLGHKDTQTTEKYIGTYKEARKRIGTILASRF
jgi:integrase